MTDSVWQVGAQWHWYDALSGKEYSFDTWEEARIMAQKQGTARAILTAVQSLAMATDSASDLIAEYFDAGTIADEDVAGLGITSANLAACVTLLQQIDKLMTNQATTAAMYRSTLNAVRRVA